MLNASLVAVVGRVCVSAAESGRVRPAPFTQRLLCRLKLLLQVVFIGELCIVRVILCVALFSLVHYFVLPAKLMQPHVLVNMGSIGLLGRAREASECLGELAGEELGGGARLGRRLDWRTGAALHE